MDLLAERLTGACRVVSKVPECERVLLQQVMSHWPRWLTCRLRLASGRNNRSYNRQDLWLVHTVVYATHPQHMQSQA